MGGNGRNDRQWIEQGAVHQHAAIQHQRRHHTGYGNRRPDGLIQRPFLKPDFLMGKEIRRHSRIGDRKVFNSGIPNHFPHHGEYLFSTNGADGAKSHIQQLQHIELTETGYPVLVILHLAGCKHAPDQGSHGTAGNGDNVVASFHQYLNRAYMGVAPGPATTKSQRNGLALTGGSRPDIAFLGRRLSSGYTGARDNLRDIVCWLLLFILKLGLGWPVHPHHFVITITSTRSP